MIYTISNDYICAEIESKGAELKSLKKGEREYMWGADPAFWGRTSPVLFPIVGSVKNKQFTHAGRSYQMGQHGFARDTEFELVEKRADYICFRLCSNEETLLKYPYQFILEIAYELKENTIKVIWKVYNPADSRLDFSIGAHPAFLCPMEGNAFVLYRAGKPIEELKFKKLSSAGTLVRKEYTVETPDGKLPIDVELFREDALVVEDPTITKVSLVNPEGEEYLTVDFQAELFGLWSPAGKGAPFVCIEPWNGRCDAEDFEGDFEDREYCHHLNSKEKFETSYEITIGSSSGEKEKGNYITTYTGRHFYPLAPNKDDIIIEDIAHALSLICRGNGHVKTFFSVGQHCLNCAREALARGYSKRVVLACLLHDASECYMSDVPRPFKKQLPSYIEAEDRLLDVIYEKFLGSPLTEDEIAQVKLMDDTMLWYDLTYLLGEQLQTPAPKTEIEISYALVAFETVEKNYLSLFQDIMLQ